MKAKFFVSYFEEDNRLPSGDRFLEFVLLQMFSSHLKSRNSRLGIWFGKARIQTNGAGAYVMNAIVEELLKEGNRVKIPFPWPGFNWMSS